MASRRKVIGGSNFARLENYANINNFLLVDRNTNGQNRRVFFSVPYDICTPEDYIIKANL